MKKTLRKLFFLTIAVTLIGSNSVFAKTEGNVYDDASLLTDSEITELNETITELQEMSGWNVYAVTTEDANGKSAMDYADDFFDEHSTEQEDGVAMLIDMDNREIYISTGGEAIRYLTDERIDAALDDAYDYVSDGAYGDCLQVMLEDTSDYYQSGIPRGQYNYDTETGEVSRHRSLTLVEAGFAFLAAIIAGVVVLFVIVGKYRLKFGTYKYAFHDYGKVDLRVNEDRYVNQTLTHRRIPKQTGSGGSSGGSSTHTGSGGHSHGGGGRSF